MKKKRINTMTDERAVLAIKIEAAKAQTTMGEYIAQIVREKHPEYFKEKK